MKRFFDGLPILKQLREARNFLRSLEAKMTLLYNITDHQFTENLLRSARYRNPKRLNRREFKVYSQNGEDGIIAEIFSRIGAGTRRFVEIGVGNGLENNTTFLLSQGWSGHWIDGNEADIDRCRSEFSEEIDAKRLAVAARFVTAENIEALLDEMNVPREIDLLSIDIDRNTYWIWNAIRRFQPRAVVVEYNAQLPSDVEWKVQYRPHKMADGTLYFGASLKSYELLGRELGYSLVGCNLSGLNAFFVRQDLCGDHFLAPFTAEEHYEPPRWWRAAPGFSGLHR